VVHLKGVRRTVWVAIIMLAITACNYPGGGGSTALTRAPEDSTATASIPARPDTETSTPAIDPIPLQEDRRQEAIMILEPGPGSRLTSPFTVRGVADPTFEQTLVAQLVDSNGDVLKEEPLMIQAVLGERGPFEDEIDVTISEHINVFLQVYATSPRDGGITHLESVGGGIELVPDGPQEIVGRDPYPERIAIFEPQVGQEVSGGIVHVEGFGVASFEGTLVLELYDAEGAELETMPIIVESPDMGTPGQFSGDIPYSIAEPMPGRLVVRDPLPVANGVNHIASVEIRLLP
jgi:hypothetical protein